MPQLMQKHLKSQYNVCDPIFLRALHFQLPAKEAVVTCLANLYDEAEIRALSFLIKTEADF